ncbi:MAG: Ig-like domain-containing protein [Pseudomonadota bacterium]
MAWNTSRLYPLVGISLLVLVTGCAVTPVPLTDEELQTQRNDSKQEIVDSQEAVNGPIDLSEAIARALRNNLDLQLEITERTLATKELELTRYDQLPELVADIDFRGRNNFTGASSRSLFTGRQSLEASTASERDVLTGNLNLTWNVLDFGVSYFRAQQAADQVLIADEERRKVVNQIVQDVKTAYWRAVSSDRLNDQLGILLSRVETAIADSKEIIAQKLDKPLTPLTYQRELITIKRELQELQRELSLAKIQLAALMNLAPGQDYELVVPDSVSEAKEPPFLPTEMEDIALAHRSEMREIAYRKRIQSQEVKAKLLELLPGVNLDFGKTYSSNTFLFNNNWLGYGNRITWNLINIFRYPATKKTLEAQSDVLGARTLALSMAIMTQVHVAYARYEHARQELGTATEYRDTQHDILDQIRAAAATKSVSEQSVIREEMNNLLAEAKYDIAHADLESAFASLYAAMGSDALQGQDSYESTSALAAAVEEGLSPVSTSVTRQQAMADFGIDEDWLQDKSAVLLASLDAEIEVPPGLDGNVETNKRIQPELPDLPESNPQASVGAPPSPIIGITKGEQKNTNQSPGFDVKLLEPTGEPKPVRTAPSPDSLISQPKQPMVPPAPVVASPPATVSLPPKTTATTSAATTMAGSRAPRSAPMSDSSATPVLHAGPEISVSEDNGPILIDIVSRYEDPDGNTLEIVNLNDQNSVGKVMLDIGKVRYDPRGAFEHLSDGQTVIDTFTYTITDGAGGDASGIVTVNVTGVNDAPIARADAASFNEDSGALAVNLLANDSDPERHTLAVVSVESANTRGIVKLINGSVFYQPGAAFATLTHGDSAKDSFSYTVKDKHGQSASADVTIDIIGRNNMPNAAPDVATFNEDDEPRAINVLANDSDSENTILSVRAVNSAATIGTVTFDGSAVTYTPGQKFDFLKAGQQVNDEFEYTVSDGDGGMQVAKVSITVIGGNDAPRAVKDTALYDEDDGANVLDLVANDSDPEQDPLTIDSVDTTGTSGLVTLSNGTVSYDPNGQFERLGAGDTAVDSFAYTVVDGNGGKSSSRVEITVSGANDAPRLK